MNMSDMDLFDVSSGSIAMVNWLQSDNAYDSMSIATGFARNEPEIALYEEIAEVNIMNNDTKSRIASVSLLNEWAHKSLLAALSEV